jgi:hypothetical protein
MQARSNGRRAQGSRWQRIMNTSEVAMVRLCR